MPHLILVIDGAADRLGIVEETSGVHVAVLARGPETKRGLTLDRNHLLRRLNRWFAGHAHHVGCCQRIVVVNDGTFWSQQRRAMSIANALAWSLFVPVASIQSTHDWPNAPLSLWKTLLWTTPPLLPVYNALPRITAPRAKT